MAVAAAGVLLLSVGYLMVDHEAAPPPDIVLVSVDTLRRDAVGLYSGSKVTPGLDHWGDHAVLFERAYAPMPFTLPSHMSMFTGLYPLAHGVDGESRVLSKRIGTLAESLRDAGYATAGIHTNEWLDAKFGFGRGFDSYEQVPHGATYAERVTRRAIAAWKAMAGEGKPRFLFVHYMDPHSDFQAINGSPLPYYSPPRFRAGVDAGVDAEFCDGRDRCATEYLVAADEEGRSLPPHGAETLHRLYLSGVAYLDEHLATLLHEVAEPGTDSDVLVVVTADHGEEFREHGRLLHSQLYDETSAVPLMIRWQRRGWTGGRVSAVVELIDLFPTILAAAGATAPHRYQGRDLWPLGRRGSGAPGGDRRRFGFGQDKLDRRTVALFGRDEKLVLHLDTGSAELYDLRADPFETRNLAPDNPEHVALLTPYLLERVQASQSLMAELGADSQPHVLSEKERRALRALGYLR